MRHRKIIFFFMVILLFSCEKTLEFDFPESESVPVVNALFSDVDGMKLSLTQSYGMNNLHIDYKLLDAHVILLENDIFVDTLVKDTSYYMSNHTLLAGNDYSIIADCDDFGEIRVDNSIPEKPIIISAEIIDSVFIELDGSVIFQLALEFADNPLTDDYYELMLFTKFYSDNEEMIDENIWTATLCEENDPVLLNENLLEFETHVIPFSDELLTRDNNALLNVNFTPPVINQILDFQLFIVFRHVSYDYYMYKKQAIKHFANQNNDIFNGMGQAVQMYSNVEDGLGIFAGFSQVMDSSLYWEK